MSERREDEVRSAAAQESERLLINLHRVCYEFGDGPDADAIREQMESPFHGMTPEEVELLRGLSADLYMISLEEKFLPRRMPEKVLVREVLDSWHVRKDPRETLRLMRLGPNTRIRKTHVAWIRSQCYERLGLYRAAREFVKFASVLEPQSRNYRTVVLALDYKVGDPEAVLQGAIGILKDAKSVGRLVIQAAVNLSKFERDRPRGHDLYTLAVNRLPEAIDYETRVKDPLPEMASLGRAILGILLERLGRREEAKQLILQVAAEMRRAGASDQRLAMYTRYIELLDRGNADADEGGIGEFGMEITDALISADRTSLAQEIHGRVHREIAVAA